MRFARSHIEFAEVHLHFLNCKLSVADLDLNSSDRALILRNSILNLPDCKHDPGDLTCNRVNSSGNFSRPTCERRSRWWEPATQHRSGQMRVCEQLTLHHFDLSVNDAIEIHLCAPSKHRVLHRVREYFGCAEFSIVAIRTSRATALL